MTDEEQRVLFERSLDELIQGATAIWKEYGLRGPGGVDASRFDPVQRAYEILTELQAAAAWDDLSSAGEKGAFPRDALPEALTTVRQRAQQCACTPQGLSFVSGEAGLIPRHDWHTSFEDALRALNEIRRFLREALDSRSAHEFDSGTDET